MCSHSTDCDPIKHSCSESCYREQHPRPPQAHTRRGLEGDFCSEQATRAQMLLLERDCSSLTPGLLFQVHAPNYHREALPPTQQTLRALQRTLTEYGEKCKP